jgi:hypothetical protein
MDIKNYDFMNYLFKVGSINKYDLENFILPKTYEKIVILMEFYDNPQIKITNWEYLKTMKEFEYSQIDFLVFSQDTDNQFILDIMPKYFSKIILDTLQELDDCDRLSTESEEEYEPIKNSKCFEEIRNALDNIDNPYSKNIAFIKKINMKFTKSNDININNLESSDILTYDIENNTIHK